MNSIQFDPRNIKNVLFDLGGVILQLDRKGHEKAFQELAQAPFEDVRARVVTDQKFKDLEMGKISMAEFRVFLRKVLVEFLSSAHPAPSLQDSELDAAWITVIQGFDKEQIDLLGHLQSLGLKLGLFSNINPVHFELVKKVYARDLGKPYTSFEDFFDGRTFYSHLIGMIKPSPAAFLEVTRMAGFNPGETLFLDDTAEHVEGARQAGLYALLTNTKDVLKLQEIFTNLR